MDTVFASPNLKILVYKKASGEYVTHGTFHGIDVLNSIPMECGSKCIFLLHKNQKENKFDNLLCVNKSGDILWQTNILSPPDFFVSIGIADGVIIANSWYGYRVLIDKNYGKEISRLFVK